MPARYRNHRGRGRGHGCSHVLAARPTRAARAGARTLRHSQRHGIVAWRDAHDPPRLLEGPAYVPLVRRAHALWHEIGTLAGETLLHETGTLDMAAEGDGVVENARQASSTMSCRTSPDGGGDHAPQAAVPPAPGHLGLLQPQGGFVASERGIVVQAGLALDAGAEIHAQERVLGFEPGIAA